MDPSPTIAIVGRPNVGKSTLFNRLIGKRHAVVAEEAGTTRDRISQSYEVEGYKTLLVDTGGLENGKQENIEADIQTQAQIAIADADLIMFVVDIAQELTVDDFAAADILRKSEKPVLLIANKCDNQDLAKNTYNIYELGFGEPILVSAIHKMGVEILTSTIGQTLKKLKFKKATLHRTQKTLTSLCILGKPNAGKSSLVNALLGADKVIVSDIPGTTRDATDTEISYKEKKYNLIDTAGLKRPGRTAVGIEKFSALRGIAAIQRSDVVILLIDGDKGVSAQDTHIAEHALEAEKGLIIAINKIDLFAEPEDDRRRIIGRLKRRFAFVPWAPIVFISAKNKRNTYEILNLVEDIMQERYKKIKTGEFTQFVQKITQKHMPSSSKMKKPKFSFAEQVDSAPPKFLFFFKNAKEMHFSYPRFLENEIRKEYGFSGTSIHLKFKEKIGKEKEKN